MLILSSFGTRIQNSFQLEKFDPNWKQGSGKPQFVAIGQPVVVAG